MHAIINEKCFRLFDRQFIPLKVYLNIFILFICLYIQINTMEWKVEKNELFDNIWIYAFTRGVKEDEDACDFCTVQREEVMPQSTALRAKKGILTDNTWTTNWVWRRAIECVFTKINVKWPEQIVLPNNCGEPPLPNGQGS